MHAVLDSGFIQRKKFLPLRVRFWNNVHMFDNTKWPRSLWGGQGCHMTRLVSWKKSKVRWWWWGISWPSIMVQGSLVLVDLYRVLNLASERHITLIPSRKKLWSLFWGGLSSFLSIWKHIKGFRKKTVQLSTRLLKSVMSKIKVWHHLYRQMPPPPKKKNGITNVASHEGSFYLVCVPFPYIHCT